ncbi:MAG: alpha-hydroxy-acid oxidizing protein [Rhodospirillaceae bacterium]|jgi:L-lactate dehydrogenase (cytochrome)/(S)-mandelate dehydrogenase|nr:alpha-hydroxy-acid oxidizing protein [Rhodospirillaceae bacterium]MBT4688002.1 alpha-hydroxy-acid oxidizing protein [Rhodospirillaceae bacterium]MBT5083484.1 alpha-hydroxy-acid oxidizing protein [Rhodospirillaceae bacterium]MBT5527245.1 alpha-hydroxy-acid oxidizing protein [Rhodospirillaceae bacterium]MBT5879970.1 alpha-hydroxy-acid oxidizing protein [Rhodospirillaceae bacterium]
MGIQDAVNYDDLRLAAKKRVPKIMFDFIEGGADDEIGLDRNQQAFRDIALVPRYMEDVFVRDQTATMFDRTYASPFGISPTGLAGMFRSGADLMLAEAARDANIPFVMSGSSNASMEDLAMLAPDHGWYQLYAARDKAISEDMIRRADAAGLSTLVLTVDVPVHSNRERNTRNRFARPLNLSLSTKLDALSYPGWLLEYMRNGMPMFDNWLPYAGANATTDDVADLVAAQTAPSLTWDDVARFRELWPRKFIIKGIMHPDDAVRCADMGCDGIVVSNHGARQLDRAPASIEVLPAIAAAVGDRMTIMLDSGVQRGSDIATALCLGADFVFVGRATLYGVTAAGILGATKAIEILQRELDLILGQIGAPDIAALGEEFIFKPQPRNY